MLRSGARQGPAQPASKGQRSACGFALSVPELAGLRSPRHSPSRASSSTVSRPCPTSAASGTRTARTWSTARPISIRRRSCRATRIFIFLRSGRLIQPGAGARLFAGLRQGVRPYPLISFNTRVTRAERAAKAGASRSRARRAPRRYDGLVVANGHHWQPVVPTYPGQFDGEILHSHDVNRRSSSRASGCWWSAPATPRSISCDAAMRRRVVHSMRRSYFFFPKTVFGKPTDCSSTTPAASRCRAS